MLPPLDSLRHQHLKLAEALSDVQAIEVPPPPSYTATTMPVANDSSFLAYRIGEDDDVDDDDDDDEEDCLAPLAPVTVHVDASARIEGLGNMVILPAAHPNTNANGNANANAGALQAQSISPTPNTGAPQTSPGSARAERLTCTILSALQNAGVIGSGGQAGNGPWQQQQQQKRSSLHRPLELHINASVSVSGERNVICAAVPRVAGTRKDLNGNGNGPATAMGLSQQVLAETHASNEAADVGDDGDGDSDSDRDGPETKKRTEGRKRRAESEPAEARKARKTENS